MKKRFICLLIIAFIVSNSIYSIGLLPKHLFEQNMVIEMSVSDDGNYIAYILLVQKSLEEEIGYAKRELHVYDIRNAEAIPLITGNVSISSVSWLPKQNVIVFRQNTKETNGIQLFGLDVKSKKISQLTYLNRSVHSYCFRNTDEIILIMQEEISQERKSLNERGIDIKIFEEESLHLELYKFNLKNAEMLKLLSGVTIYDFVVSSDGKKIAAAVSEKNHIDYKYMFQRIHILDAETGRIIKTIDNPGKLGKMVWSPDSKYLAFLSASDLYDSVVGSLFVADTENKEERFADLKNLVEKMELSVVDVIWEDTKTLMYAAIESVDVSITRLELGKDKRTIVKKGGLAVFNSFTKVHNNIYYIGNTPHHPNELLSYDLKKNVVSRLTNHNEWLDKVQLSKQEKVSYTARDGKRIEGVLVYPLDYVEGKQYPMIVYIHGGPESAVLNGWNNHYSTWGQYAATKGFFVFSPNYRASSGRGVEFTMYGFGDLLGVEYDDVLDGIDYLIEKGLADKNKVGIGGGSYGGYFAAYSATKHSERFAAAVVFVGIANQISKRKTTDIPYEDYYVHWGFWTHENWEKVWNASPIQYVKNSTTPTLILHGEEDTRIPVSQGLELYRGLSIHGAAPVRFVLYPGEGHGNAKNINRYDYLLRTLEWFEYYLIQNIGSKEMPSKYIDYLIFN